MRSYRRTAAAVLAVSMTVLLAADVHADDTMTYEEALQAAYDIVPDTNNIRGWPQGPHVYGNSAVVVDMDSGAVLYGKKADERHYPASITKLMTALVALENSEPDDEVLFSQDSVSFLEYGDASIGMTPGEILSMNDAMYGMLLASANEVSYAIAESVGKLMGGDYNTFLQAMNDRAEELGCTDSHWMNANGLHNDQHYTTAHDMARIASAVYQFEEFRTVTQTLNYTIGPTNLVGESRTFQQNHKMLWPGNPNYYEYCTGGKTGYTDQSRTTLVTMADNGNMRLVAVLLQDDGDVYADTRAMFDYVYSNFSKVQLKGQPKAEGISSYEDDAAYVVLPAGIDFSSLDSEITITDKKEGTGKVTYFYEGQDVGSADVVLTPEYVKEQTGYDITPRITEKGSALAGGSEDGTGLPLPVKILIGTGAAAAVLFLAFCAWVRYLYIKKKKRRMAMARRRRRRYARYAMERDPHPSRRRRRR
ncbi:MAG TPA: D-alanyl-D-alanine carboxypeptidase [Candidatus Mediterraneibacter tabaqchaliae]|uniref:D-alanyl-D-alanine carboxypeptidase n=1 Tax=Candidatus Mediterraneibacter tabaqchaliae TaxID=2838689 RepID=A0A9D2R5P2_9FIRM|nr:D-alanyl-D-alanine carboxypeptidase [Candidatus Mediterraneibacter tabaqchaliae]